jgi:glycosyltransferase involved in cell wall biosynthesis
MAMGVPVVCSHIGFSGLGIKNGEGAIMEREQVAFAKSVIDLLSSASKRKAVGEEGMSVIRSRFDWDIIAKKLEGYFKEIIGSAPEKITPKAKFTP